MAAWRSLSELTHLQLGGNNFTGTLPPELATMCPHLVSLNVSSSKFTGANHHSPDLAWELLWVQGWLRPCELHHNKWRCPAC